MTGDHEAPLLLTVTVNDLSIPALCDTGAIVTVMSKDTARRAKLEISQMGQSNLKVADTNGMKVLGTARASISITLDGHGKRWTGIVHVVEKLSYALILGRNVLKDLRVCIDCAVDKVSFDDVGAVSTDKPVSDAPTLNSTQTITIEPRSSKLIEVRAKLSEGQIAFGPLNPTRMALVPNGLTEIKESVCLIGVTNFTHGCSQIRAGTPLAHYETFVDYNRQLPASSVAALKLDPGKDAARAQCFVVGKKLSRSQRNALQILLQAYRDVWDGNIGQTEQASHRIELTPDAKPKKQALRRYSAKEKAEIIKQVEHMLSANIIERSSSPWSSPIVLFATDSGQFQFVRMPFGVRNAGATFQALMDSVLNGLKGTDVLVYLDDVIVATADWDKHLESLAQVLQRFRRAELKMKANKCLFGHSGLRFLGHYIGAGNSSKTRAIDKMEALSDVKGVERFLGMAGYYRRFVPDFARIAQPMTDLKKKDTPFPRIKTDASLIGLGAVLSQEERDGWHPVAYASRRTSSCEANLSATELEGLGIVWAVEYFRPYILGKSVEIATDHTALCALCDLGKRRPLPRKLAR
ncbi:Retrovirus-related Pol polyprotein from transposon 17.6, partial [Fragariocoptes setiger]